jgi:hypothetical protein
MATTAAIQRVLNRYRDAFSTLDIRAVQSVWPSSNAQSLRADFHQLDEHNIEYESCRIAVSGPRAAAVCRGVAQWTPSGGREIRRATRQWQFALRAVDVRWVIDDVVLTETERPRQVRGQRQRGG